MWRAKSRSLAGVTRGRPVRADRACRAAVKRADERARPRRARRARARAPPPAATIGACIVFAVQPQRVREDRVEEEQHLRRRGRAPIRCAAVRIVSLPTSGTTHVGPQLVEDRLERAGSGARSARRDHASGSPVARPSRSVRRRAASACRSARRSARPVRLRRARPAARAPPCGRAGTRRESRCARSAARGAARVRDVRDLVAAPRQLGATRRRSSARGTAAS